MSKSRLVPVRGGFADKVRKLINSETDFSETGWFSEQGEHPTSDMSFAELAEYHATGSNRVTHRPMLHIGYKQFYRQKPKIIGESIINFLNSPSKQNLDSIADSIGKSYWKAVYNTLGDPVLLGPVTTNPTPLVDSGELKSHLRYRTKRNQTLRP